MLNLGIPHLLLLLQLLLLLLLLLLLKCQGWADRFGLLLRLPRVFSWSVWARARYLMDWDKGLNDRLPHPFFFSAVLGNYYYIKNIANERNERH
ncbi:uncharacterized protein FMAN_03112 [Fusarium mangiferae]|uniref:Uncharacterized protein n=1 Tax=Fusarium mangiferae TaxID=192010 RepID=A0A1L7T722_FUSMA|nr:uncharacterized protein FMAN_03112 [Fusarium mangiferae]CVK93729.1 uncharacterized protein FMAN_03112 [Fusarium mangiferae]